MKTQVLGKALAELSSAEIRMRALMQAAIETGDYGDVQDVARLASQVASLVQQYVQGSGEPAELAAGQKEEATDAVITSSRARRARRKSRRDAKSKYPQFERLGNQLVKVSWSKAKKAEYTHRAPKAVAVALLQAIQEAGESGELITMDAMLPLFVGDTEVPSYQSYLSLKWLAAIGAVQQHGKQGYSVSTTSPASRVIDAEFQSLKNFRSS